jgi:hypothetical protein
MWRVLRKRRKKTMDIVTLSEIVRNTRDPFLNQHSILQEIVAYLTTILSTPNKDLVALLMLNDLAWAAAAAVVKNMNTILHRS